MAGSPDQTFCPDPDLSQYHDSPFPSSNTWIDFSTTTYTATTLDDHYPPPIHPSPTLLSGPSDPPYLATDPPPHHSSLSLDFFRDFFRPATLELHLKRFCPDLEPTATRKLARQLFREAVEKLSDSGSPSPVDSPPNLSDGWTVLGSSQGGTVTQTFPTHTLLFYDGHKLTPSLDD